MSRDINVVLAEIRKERAESYGCTVEELPKYDKLGEDSLLFKITGWTIIMLFIGIMGLIVRILPGSEYFMLGIVIILMLYVNITED